MHELTIRQMISEAIKGKMLTTKEISKALSIKEKDVLEHLRHVARTGGRKGRFVVDPPICHTCGFVFKKRSRIGTPSRCPVCRSEGIIETRYGISTIED
jgi:hypothetical protein